MNDDINKNLEFLVTKSRDLLQEQLKSFENCNNKAAMLISISSLFVPIAISFLTTDDLSTSVKSIALLSVLITIIGISFLLKVTTPKGLDHGFNFNQFEEKVNGSYSNLLTYEISANKSSFEDNEKIVFTQLKNLKNGLKSIFISLLFLLLTGIIVLFNKSETINKFKNIKIEIFKIKNMDNNNQQSENTNQNGQAAPQTDTNQESTIRFEPVPSSERANIQKGDDSQPLHKDKKD